MKCSFCEQPLVCQHCKQPVRPREGATLTALYQPDMHVVCPECRHVLICKSCGYVYGEEAEEEPAQ
jgi:hypothetical protein